MGTGFRELKVWREAKALAVDVYRLTEASGLSREFSLRDQIRRAAVSVPSNIAEGDERDTDKDGVRFLYIAKGSLAELSTQLEIALDIGLVSPAEHAPIEERCGQIARMLGALIKARRSST